MSLAPQQPNSIASTGDRQNLASTVLDLSVLQSIRQMAGTKADAAVKSLIDCYLQDVPELLQIIQTAISNADSETLRKAAHRLRSSSAIVGAVNLSQVGKQLETIGRNGSVANTLELVARAESEYVTVKVALQSHTELDAEMYKSQKS